MIFEVLMPFILTFGLEWIVLARARDPIRTALHAFLINALTWPIAPFTFFYVLMCLPRGPSSMIPIQLGAASVPLALSFLIAVEVGVILAEAALISLLFEIGRKRSLVASCLANFASAPIGYALVFAFLYS